MMTNEGKEQRKNLKFTRVEEEPQKYAWRLKQLFHKLPTKFAQRDMDLTQSLGKNNLKR